MRETSLESEGREFMTRKIFLIMIALLIIPCVSNAKEIPVKRAYMSQDERFVTYGGIVVWDTKTYLEWVTGPDRDTTWEKAKLWVQNLFIDGGGWRMPTRSELKGIYQKGIGTRNMTSLLQTSGWNVWSSETTSSSKPLGFYFKHGVDISGAPGESYTSRAFAVRLKRIRSEQNQDIKPSKKEVKRITEKNGQYTLAVLPWRLMGSSSMWNHHAIRGLKKALYLNKSVSTVYSYYDLKARPNPKLLDKDLINGDIYWKSGTGKGRISAKPNVDLACELGQRLGVDTVLMSAINLQMTDPVIGCIKVFLINVKTKKMSWDKACVEDFEAEGALTFMFLSDNLLYKYSD